jgi:hypothetical protein
MNRSTVQHELEDPNQFRRIGAQRPKKVRWSVLWVICVLSHAHFAVGQPVRVAVTADAQSIWEGENAKLKCVLLDKENHPIQTPKDLTLLVQAASRTGKVIKTNVVIHSGQSSYSWEWSLPEAGVTEIKAQHDHLLSRDTFIMVKPSAARIISSTKSNIRPEASPPKTIHPLPPISGPAGIRITHPGSATTVEGASAANAPDSALGKPLGLILEWGTETHLADGEDAASIFAFLDENCPATHPAMTITLFNHAGKMMPTQLVINKGTDNAQAQVTSDRPGAVAVDFVKSTPPATISGPSKISLSFGPPITTLGVKASPLKISLLETCDIVVSLQDKHGVSVPTDVGRHVSLAVDSGGGILANPDLVIAANNADARTKFTPIRWGQTTIRASTPNLYENTTPVTIVLPGLLLALSGFGGLIGGGVAAVAGAPNKKTSKAWRVAVGVVTGFVFYWACIFINGYVKISPGIALNPISTVALATIGGFAGTKVLSGLLKFFTKA